MDYILVLARGHLLLRHRLWLIWTYRLYRNDLIALVHELCGFHSDHAYNRWQAIHRDRLLELAFWNHKYRLSCLLLSQCYPW